MKLISFWAIALLLTISLGSCGDDDSSNSSPMSDDEGMDMDGPSELSIARDATITTITTNGDEKIWRFSSALLTNTSGSFDISTNFNVVDDEFVFSGTADNGFLVWRQGNDIGVTGSNNQETLLDFYKSPEESSFSFNPDSSSELTALEGRMTFTVIDDNTITGTLIFEDTRSVAGETIDFTLTEKTSEDFASPPSAGLNFTTVAEFEAEVGSFTMQNNVGFIGSNADNSLFIAYRNGLIPNSPNRMIKYSIDSDDFVTRDDTFMEFVTRKLNIVNNQLILTGGTNIYTYDLDLSTEPIITPHNAGSLTRYGTATVNNDIYVIGGDLNDVANRIRRINSDTGNLDVVTTMPRPRVHAGGEFVNDNLYIFGGREAFVADETVTTESFIYNLSTQNFSNFDLPVLLSNSYASRQENLIYIAGDIRIDNDDDGVVDEIEIWLGVYDTLDDSITEISHNLDDGDPFTHVQTMTIFNGRMYVIFGSILVNPNGTDNTFTILATDL